MNLVIMRFLFVFCILGGFVSAARGLEREAFTIAKYDLAITLEPDQQRLGARGKITLRNDSGQPQKIAALQISSSLNWRSIRVDGKAVQFVSQPYVSDIDHTGALSEAIVTLPVEIKPKDSVELEIGYEGVIPLDATRLTRIGVPEGIAKHSSWDQISPSFTAVRGAGYVAWYPITTESADFSEGNSLVEVVDRGTAREVGSEFKAKVTISHESGEELPSMICSPGRRNDDRIADRSADRIEEGTRGAQQVSTECLWIPLGTVTPTFATANYQDRSKPPLYLFSLPGHEAGASTYSNALEPAMKFVSAWFGKPTTAIAVADLADPNSAPFESGTLLMASMAAEDSKLAGTNLVHELVHSALPSSRPWVYEGLAHFAEALYREEQGGREAALDLLGLHRAAFLDSEKEIAATQKNLGQPLAATFDETYYRSKAAYVWWMLRDMIGDDALKRAIGKYRAEEDKDPKYVERLIEAAAKRELGWFFDDWVYQDRGLPDFRVQSVHPWTTEKGVQFITVTLENLGRAGAEVPFTILFEGGEITKRIEVRAKSTATTRVELIGTANEIRVNDGSVPESDLTNNVFRIDAEQK